VFFSRGAARLIGGMPRVGTGRRIAGFSDISCFQLGNGRCGSALPLHVTAEVCRGGEADHERYHSQADPQPVWSCGAVAVRG
jgi:hypothetical protein